MTTTFNRTLMLHQRKLHSDSSPAPVLASPMVLFADKIQTLHLPPSGPCQIVPVLPLPSSQCYKLLDYLCSCLEPSSHLWRSVNLASAWMALGKPKRRQTQYPQISSFHLISGATSSQPLLNPFPYIQSVNSQCHDLGC